MNKQEAWIVWNKKEDIPFRTIKTGTDILHRAIITFDTEGMCLDFIKDFFELDMKFKEYKDIKTQTIKSEIDYGLSDKRKIDSVMEIYEPRLIWLEFIK